MSICLDYAEALGARYDKEGILHWPLNLNPPSHTAGDVVPPRCLQCGMPEHGTSGCKEKDAE